MAAGDSGGGGVLEVMDALRGLLIERGLAGQSSECRRIEPVRGEGLAHAGSPGVARVDPRGDRMTPLRLDEQALAPKSAIAIGRLA